MSTNTTDTGMASWAEVLSGQREGWPLAAVAVNTRAWLRSWEMAGANGEADGPDLNAVAMLTRRLRRLEAHTPATLPEYLMNGWRIDLEVITAQGPVPVSGRLRQNTMVDWPIAWGVRLEVIRTHPCQALTVVTDTGLPVLVWADRVVNISHYPS